MHKIVAYGLFTDSQRLRENSLKFLWEMMALEMEQRLGSFRKRDFRVWRCRQW